MSKCVAVVMSSQTRALRELSGANSLVVATGGGAVVRDGNWYIFLSYTLLCPRFISVISWSNAKPQSQNSLFGSGMVYV